MPYVTVCHEDQNGDGSVPEDKDKVRLYYHTYGKGPIKVLLIMGFAAGHGAWGPQLLELVGTSRPNEDEDGTPLAVEDNVVDSSANGTDKADSLKNNVTCVAFDNRGVGLSSAPEDKSRYTTKIMAKDALALMSSLGWEKAHVVGHSMGGMIASKLAVIAPDRVASLALVSVSCGGYHAVPKLTLRSMKVMYRLLKAKTIEQRAWVDLDTHYSKDHLEEIVEGKARRDALFEEYVNNMSNSGMQAKHGVDGHFNACWTHSITKSDVKALESGNILVSVIHGRHDIIAHVSAGELMALRLRRLSKMVHLPGGHMIPLEKPKELGEAVRSLIEAAEGEVSPLEWTKGSSLAGRIEQVGVGKAEHSEIFCCCYYTCPLLTRKVEEGQLSTLVIDGSRPLLNFCVWPTLSVLRLLMLSIRVSCVQCFGATVRQSRPNPSEGDMLLSSLGMSASWGTKDLLLPPSIIEMKPNMS